MGHVFTMEEMAQSRGTGQGRPRPGEENKPLLDGEKLATLKGKFINFFVGIQQKENTFKKQY